MGGGPDEETLRRLIEVEGLSDSELAELYGVTRPSARYWRLRAGIEHPGPGRGKRPRRPRATHKAYSPWKVRAEHMHHPIRKRLILVSKLEQGHQLSEAEQIRAEEFLEYIRENDVVVDYDANHLAHGEPSPFFFRKRDPRLDAAEDIIRRPRD